MGFQADIVIRGAGGQPVAIVELKNWKDLTPDVGAELRRGLTASHSIGPQIPFFLLLSQEKGFLWHGPPADSTDQPACAFSMTEVIRYYLPDLGADQWLGPDSFRLVVLQWLYDLIDGKRGEESEAERALAEGGLFAVLWGAGIMEEVAV
jgi:hypothetical protein